MPYTIKRLADVERHNTDFLPRTQSVGPALGHGGEQIEGLVATAKTELVWVQFRAKETLEPVIDEVFKDLAHDREQGNGPVVPGHTLGLLLVSKRECWLKALILLDRATRGNDYSHSQCCLQPVQPSAKADS